MTSCFQDNEQKGRFELERSGLIVFANYRRRAGTLAITHVEAPIPLRGTGAASELMENIMVQARAEGARVLPLCSYARTWLQRHSEHRDLTA
jgi:hypothetical protein